MILDDCILYEVEIRVDLYFFMKSTMDYKAKSLQEHKRFLGKLWVVSRVPLETKDDLATYYSPGVAEPCLQIAEDPKKAYEYTWKSRSVAVVSDGSAVLWLWNIGWLAGLPVMEWKAILFKGFADVDAVPLVLNTQDPDQIISIVEAISPTFWGINLEDIKAPECFYIEEKLKQSLDIPVFHDDQHGTAIVVLAWLINALKVVKKEMKDIDVVIAWAGAAGIAIANLLIKAWVQSLVVLDSRGAIAADREWLNPYKAQLIPYNTKNKQWSLSDVIGGADVFVGVAQAGILSKEDVRAMGSDPIVFALSNPAPEIMPQDAYAAWAKIVATGRSDYPNQINNVLVFPGIFRGALDNSVRAITDQHKLDAAFIIAGCVTNPSVEKIVPDALEVGISDKVASVII